MTTPHSSFQLLPLEISEQIADLVAEDSDGSTYDRIELLSLVELCRSWKDSGERAMWKSVRIDPWDDELKFLATLASDDPRLTYIHTFIFKHSIDFYEPYFERYRGCFDLSNDDFNKLFDLLPRLKLRKLELHLSYRDWVRMRRTLANVVGLKDFTIIICWDDEFNIREEPLGIASISSLLSLTALTYDSDTGGDMEIFFENLTRFNMKRLIIPSTCCIDLKWLFLRVPNLVELQVSECYFDNFREGFDISSFPPTLRKLGQVSFVGLEEIFKNLRDKPFFLTTIHIHSFLEEEEYGYLRYMPACVEEIGFEFTNFCVLAVVLESIEILELKKLLIISEKYDPSLRDQVDLAWKKGCVECRRLGVEIENVKRKESVIISVN